MPTRHFCATAAARLLRPALLLTALAAAFGMVGRGTAVPLPDPVVAAPALSNESQARPAEALSFADAVDQLTIALFTHAKFDPADAAGRILVIDPLIDHTSGNQAVATQAMEPRIVRIVNERFGRINTQPFNLESPADQPSDLRASHICGTKCHVPALEKGVETAETPGDGFRAGWLVAA